jgi:hypothetical protein
MALSGITLPKLLPASKWLVWKRSLPALCLPRSCSHWALQRNAVGQVVQAGSCTSSLRKRLTWRALRLASEVPFLPLSSSSITCMGR